MFFIFGLFWVFSFFSFSSTQKYIFVCGFPFRFVGRGHRDPVPHILGCSGVQLHFMFPCIAAESRLSWSGSRFFCTPTPPPAPTARESVFGSKFWFLRVLGYEVRTVFWELRKYVFYKWKMCLGYREFLSYPHGARLFGHGLVGEHCSLIWLGVYMVSCGRKAQSDAGPVQRGNMLAYYQVLRLSKIHVNFAKIWVAKHSTCVSTCLCHSCEYLWFFLFVSDGPRCYFVQEFSEQHIFVIFALLGPQQFCYLTRGNQIYHQFFLLIQITHPPVDGMS